MPSHYDNEIAQAIDEAVGSRFDVTSNDEERTVTGRLHAIAAAVNRLADAVEGLRS